MSTINFLKDRVCNKKNQYLRNSHWQHYRRFKTIQRINSHPYYVGPTNFKNIIMTAPIRFPCHPIYPEYQTWDRTGRSHTDHMFPYEQK